MHDEANEIYHGHDEENELDGQESKSQVETCQVHQQQNNHQKHAVQENTEKQPQDESLHVEGAEEATPRDVHCAWHHQKMRAKRLGQKC